MDLLIGILRDFRHYFNPRTTWGLVRLAIIIGATVVVSMMLGTGVTEEEEVIAVPTVQVATAQSFSGDTALSLIGSVTAVDQAELETETSGRVTRVAVTLGDTVSAGTIIAELENAAQYASLLQAEGSYEAAVAAAAQSDISVDESAFSVQSAKDSAISAHRSAFNAADDIVITLIDDFFSNPDSRLPGLRIDGGSKTLSVNDQRVALQTILSDWQVLTNDLTTNSDFDSAYTVANNNLLTVRTLVDDLLTMTTDEDNDDDTLVDGDMDTYASLLLNARTTIESQRTSLESTLTTIQSAEEALSRVTLSGTETDLSAANAQVKQALGSLRAAQAAYNETIIRTPISGTINSLPIRTGEFVGTFTPVATIANNNALEVTLFVGDADRNTITLGQTVEIEGGATGIVTAIAPAVDPVTRKTEVKIGTESPDITNGDTVRVFIAGSEIAQENEAEVIIIPITAVKFSDTNGVVFTVENGVLVSHPVTTGQILNANVTILDGIEATTEIVVDARGLTAGAQVEAIN